MDIIHFTFEDKKILDIFKRIITLDDEDTFEESLLVFKDFYETKSIPQKIGIISEIGMLISSVSSGLLPIYQYKSIEDKMMKKGFDGVFSDGEELIIAESKSTSTNKEDYKVHHDNFKECKKHMDKNLSGINGKRPWMNARNHMKVAKYNDKSLASYLEKLSSIYKGRKSVDRATVIVLFYSGSIHNGGTPTNDDEFIEYIGDYKSGKLIIVKIKSIKHFEKELKKLNA